ncbi:MAG: MFS transporter [Planctomycetota bacterium]|nr:MAG: MFS transporter [Planctomycetota bacterium]
MSDHVTPPPGALKLRLSIMMFLQYGIWGAWLPLFYQFLNEHRGFGPSEIGTLFAVSAIGALVAPFLAGQIADRYFNTEKFLGISHILGGVLVWQLAWIESYSGLLLFGLVYSLVYAPTLSLTNSLAFHHLPDRDRDFGKVRVWGTVGWIIAGIGIGQWLLFQHTPEIPVGLTGEAAEKFVSEAQIGGMADSFRLSGILGVLLGLFCFSLPATPPQKEKKNFAAAEAMAEIKGGPLLILFLVAFPVSVVHQFYFVHTAGFLRSLDLTGSTINKVFGVGGGGLMTVGQMSEILVLAAMPIVAKLLGRKWLLTIGLCAYVVRFAVFAYMPHAAAVVPALTLHGLCFGCFFFIAFMVVDEMTTSDVRASAQALFNVVVVGVGIIVGNFFAGFVGKQTNMAPEGADPDYNYQLLFGIPMWISIACLVALLILYPRKVNVVEPST